MASSQPSCPGFRAGIALLLAAGTAAAHTAPAPYDELLAKAARQGSLRVIVEVRPDGPAPPTREAIAQAQAVSADALRRLAGSLFVASIREDMVLRPQGTPASP